MKREDLIKKLNINIPNNQKNVFLDTDFANEADDPFAVIHYILSPSINLVGIGVEHFNKKNSDSSCDKSYSELKKMLDIIKLDDVFVYMGSNKPIDLNNIIDNPASLKIIEEAKKGKLYVVTIGALTNLALALLKDPSISNNITVIVNGGTSYLESRAEFNISQDVEAANVVFDSDCEIIQIPQNVYNKLEVSLSYLKYELKNSSIGNYLYNLVETINIKEYNPNFLLRSGENWTLGDNATIGFFLLNRFRDFCKLVKRPRFNKDGSYNFVDTNKTLTLYHDIDSNFILNDLFSKIRLVFGE